MKKRLLSNNIQIMNSKDIEQQTEYKSSMFQRLRFLFYANRLKKEKLVWPAVFLFFLITLTYLFFKNHSFAEHNSEMENNIDEQLILPIGDATDKNYYITRPNGRDDGGAVRVMFMIASDKINYVLCYALASAYFTNIPIVVTGYKLVNFSNIYKPSMFLEAIDKARLEDVDIVILLDFDLMFTGLDYLPFIDKFIKLSPANLNELDAKAIRTGKMMAPSTYSAEKNCYAPQTLPPEGARCHTAYEQIYKKHNEYVKNLTEFAEKPFANYVDNKIEHFNSGTSIQRVWAMRKLFAGFYKFMARNKPNYEHNIWKDDQSVFAKLYLELRLWEIEQDYFRKHTDELRTMSNEYGLYAGMMGLDLKGELSVLLHQTFTRDVFQITNEHWQTSKSEEIESINVFDKRNDAFIQNLYNKTNVKKVFTQRKLTRSYSNVHSVTIAPPLLSIVPRHINGKDKPAERVYPALIHFAGPDKEPRYKDAFGYMQWSLPMMFDREEWKRDKEYAMSMPIEVWTSNDEKLRLRYGDVCEKHPFNFNIKTL